MLNHSYSYSNNDSPYRFTLTVEEVERLSINKLIINGFEIIPYKYSERYEDGIIINTKWRILKDDNVKLRDAINKQEYFTVIRDGICDKEMEMRFGQVLWSDDSEYIKQDVVLVQKTHDDGKEPMHGFCEPELSNVMQMLAETTNLNNELISLLVSKGIITSSEIEKIKEEANQKESKTINMFFHVDDIDTY